MTQTQSEFKEEAKKELSKAWARDQALLTQRLSAGGKRPDAATWALIKGCYELGFYSGLKVKIEWTE